MVFTDFIKGLIKNNITKIKIARCKHEFVFMHQERCIGKTIDWGARVVNHYEDTCKCTKCGVEKNERYIYFGGIK